MRQNALILSGGGARGAYQIGVWQALRELDIPFQLVAGTSVGALNAAIIAMDDFENARSLWMNMKTDMVFEVEIDESLPERQQEAQLLRQFARDYATQGGVGSSPLKQLLDTHINEEILRKSGVACGFVCVDKKTLQPLKLYAEEIPEGMLTEYLVAGASLPPAVQSHSIGGKDYIDGGIYDNLPVELATQKGFENVIAVDLEAVGMVRKETLRQVRNLTTIRSYWNLGPLLRFDPKRQARNIRLGYLDGMKTYRAFEGIAYTFVKGELSAFIKRKKEVSALQNQALGLTFGTDASRREEIFLLRIETFLRRKYGQEIKLKYSAFLLACAESAGEIFGLDCEKIYTLESFWERLQEQVNQVELLPVEEGRISGKALRESLSLLDKTVRTAHLALLIRRAALWEKKMDLLGLSLLMPDELLGGYFIALFS